jgi:hypothetical protein
MKLHARITAIAVLSLSSLTLLCSGLSQMQAHARKELWDVKQADKSEKKRKYPAGKRACLEVSGAAQIKGMAVKEMDVRLYEENILLTEIPSSAGPKVFFTLKENSNYMISYSRAGYVPRVVCIDTHLPGEVKLNPLFTFDFELELLPVSTALNAFYLDFPVAIIQYDPDIQKFGYNRKYTSSIKTDTRELVPAFDSPESGK